MWSNEYKEKIYKWLEEHKEFKLAKDLYYDHIQSEIFDGDEKLVEYLKENGMVKDGEVILPAGTKLTYRGNSNPWGAGYIYFELNDCGEEIPDICFANDFYYNEDLLDAIGCNLKEELGIHTENQEDEKPLTEAPDEYGLPTDDELADEEERERAELEKKLAAKRAKRDAEKKAAIDKEEADKKAAQEREQKLASVKDKVEEIKALVAKEKEDTLFENLFNILVPDRGPAETLAGELIRAWMRVMYRSWNDGDVFFEGYGLETCGPEAAFVCENADEDIAQMIRDLAEDCCDEATRKEIGSDYTNYDNRCKEIAQKLADSILGDYAETLVTSTKFDCNKEYKGEDYWSDYIPKYEYELYIPESIQKHINAYNISLSDVVREVEMWLDDSNVFYGAQVNSGWSDTIVISDLTLDGYREIESWDSHNHIWNEYIEELNNEYGDPDDVEDEDEYYEDEDDVYEELSYKGKVAKRSQLDLMDSQEEYIYLFPICGAMEPISDCENFNLTLLGKNYFEDEKNYVVKGSREDLEAYADYLGYELHPDYLYVADEFAGDIVKLNESSSNNHIEYKGVDITVQHEGNLEEGEAGAYYFSLDGQEYCCDYIEDCYKVIDAELSDGAGARTWGSIYLNESLNEDNDDNIYDQYLIDWVGKCFETGHGWAEDFHEFVKMIKDDFGSRIRSNKLKQLYSKYQEMRELGPVGFYQEYKNRFNFSSDYISQYGDEESINAIEESKAQNPALVESSTDMHLLVGVGHFNPDNVVLVKDTKDNLTNLLTKNYSCFEYNDMEPYSSNLFYISNNDESIQIWDTKFSSLENYKLSLSSEVQKCLEEAKQFGDDYIDADLNVPPYYLYIDFDDEKDISVDTIVNELLDQIKNSYVDNDSSDNKMFISGTTLQHVYGGSSSVESYSSVEEFLSCYEDEYYEDDDAYEEVYRCFVYDDNGEVVSDGFVDYDDAYDFAIERGYNIIKQHCYYRETPDSTLKPLGEPKVIADNISKKLDERLVDKQDGWVETETWHNAALDFDDLDYEIKNCVKQRADNYKELADEIRDVATNLEDCADEYEEFEEKEDENLNEDLNKEYKLEEPFNKFYRPMTEEDMMEITGMTFEEMGSPVEEADDSFTSLGWYIAKDEYFNNMTNIYEYLSDNGIEIAELVKEEGKEKPFLAYTVNNRVFPITKDELEYLFWDDEFDDDEYEDDEYEDDYDESLNMNSIQADQAQEKEPNLCPHCKAELPEDGVCPECSKPEAELIEAKSDNKFEVLYYTELDDDGNYSGDPVTIEFDTRKEAIAFYKKHSKDEDKYGWWVTERDEDWEVVKDIITEGKLNTFESKKINIKTSFTEEEVKQYAEELSRITYEKGSYVDVYPNFKGDECYLCAYIEDGDWKHDHLAFENTVRRYFKEKGITVKINGEVVDSEDTFSDCYSVSYEIKKVI